MSRYIDADRLLSVLNENKIPYNSDINYFICHAPTADVVEVVRCKNCKYWDNHDGGERCLNEVGLLWAQPNSFCNHGKRREDGEIY